MQAQADLMLVVSWLRNDFLRAKTNLTRKAIFNPEWYPDISEAVQQAMFVAAWDKDRG